MSRPQKTGLDYYPHDTDAMSDEKVESLQVLYGNDGYALYFKLLERIYRTNDFELPVCDTQTRHILAHKCLLTIEKFEEILTAAIKFGCFDKESYDERGVLTSPGIKKRASYVVEKRLKMRQKRDTATQTWEQTRQQTPTQTPQSKVKESKVKESKVTTTILPEPQNRYEDVSVGFTEHAFASIVKAWNEEPQPKPYIVNGSVLAVQRLIVQTLHTFRLSGNDMIDAIVNYHKVLSLKESMLQHRWNIKDFLESNNGLQKFIEPFDIERYTKKTNKPESAMMKRLAEIRKEESENAAK